MKKMIFLSILFVFMFPAMIFCQVNNVPATSETLSLGNIFSWLVENWVSISLIISELAALLSAKYSGILKTILHLLDIILRKKKESPNS